MFEEVLQTSLILNLLHLSKQISFNIMKYLNNFYLPVPTPNLHILALANYDREYQKSKFECNATIFIFAF